MFKSIFEYNNVMVNESILQTYVGNCDKSYTHVYDNLYKLNEQYFQKIPMFSKKYVINDYTEVSEVEIYPIKKGQKPQPKQHNVVLNENGKFRIVNTAYIEPTDKIDIDDVKLYYYYNNHAFGEFSFLIDNLMELKGIGQVAFDLDGTAKIVDETVIYYEKEKETCKIINCDISIKNEDLSAYSVVCGLDSDVYYYNDIGENEKLVKGYQINKNTIGFYEPETCVTLIDGQLKFYFHVADTFINGKIDKKGGICTNLFYIPDCNKFLSTEIFSPSLKYDIYHVFGQDAVNIHGQIPPQKIFVMKLYINYFIVEDKNINFVIKNISIVEFTEKVFKIGVTEFTRTGNLYIFKNEYYALCQINKYYYPDGKTLPIENPNSITKFDVKMYVDEYRELDFDETWPVIQAHGEFPNELLVYKNGKYSKILKFSEFGFETQNLNSTSYIYLPVREIIELSSEIEESSNSKILFHGKYVYCNIDDVVIRTSDQYYKFIDLNVNVQPDNVNFEEVTDYLVKDSKYISEYFKKYTSGTFKMNSNFTFYGIEYIVIPVKLTSYFLFRTNAKIAYFKYNSKYYMQKLD